MNEIQQVPEPNSYTATNLVTYTWDAANQLVKLVQNGTVQLAPSYRPDSRPYYGGSCLFDGEDLLAIVSGSSVSQHFTRGAHLVKVYWPAFTTLYYDLDAQGSAVGWTKTDGTYYGPGTVAAWGNNMSENGPLTYIAERSYCMSNYYQQGIQRVLFQAQHRWLMGGGPGWISPEPRRFDDGGCGSLSLR